jgi:hypothetical protein
LRCCFSFSFAKAEAFGEGNLDKGFVAPPDDVKPRVYWFWIYNRVDKAGINWMDVAGLP